MRINFTTPTKEKRKIKTCQAGEAFRWGDSWYIKLNVNDNNMPYFGDFYEEHRLTDMPEPKDYDEAIAVMHLGSQGYCYVNGELEADEWANISANLSVK